MFSKKPNQSKKSEDVKKSAGKVVDPKRDTPTRAKHLRIFLDNAELYEIIPFFEAYYSHIFYIVYDAFITAEINLRQKGAHKAQKEELESVLYLFERVLIYLPEHLARKWQYHSVGRLMSKLLHPGNSWKLLKREAMRLFLLWYQILGEIAGEALHAMFATLVPGFPSPYQGLGLTALAAMTPDTMDGPVNPAEICPLIPAQAGERSRSPDTDLTRIFLDVLLELMVSQVTLIEWKENKLDRQRRCLNFLFEKFKTFYMPHIFPEFNWGMSLYRPSLELPEMRKFRPAFVDAGDGTKKIDPMLLCRVVVIKWVAQYTHMSRSSSANAVTSASNTNLLAGGGQDLGGGSTSTLHNNSNSNNHNDSANLSSQNLNISGTEINQHNQSQNNFANNEETDSVQGYLVRDILYGNRENVNFVHEVYRQAFLLSFSHSPAIKKVITVYKDWIQMNVVELPSFILEPPPNSDKEREEFLNAMSGKLAGAGGLIPGNGFLNSDGENDLRHKIAVRAGLQNVLQIFVTNAANVFLLEISPEYPILLEEQVEMCKRVLNIYRYMVMNVKMEARTWEQLLFILLQITQLTLPEAPPRMKREDTLGGRLAQAIFQTLIVTWIKANLYVVVSSELWDQFLDVLSSLTLWEELIREWAKTMETLTRVLARQVYHLDLNDLPLDRLSERATKKRRGQRAPQEIKVSGSNIQPNPGEGSTNQLQNQLQNPGTPSGSGINNHSEGGRNRSTSETGSESYHYKSSPTSGNHHNLHQQGSTSMTSGMMFSSSQSTSGFSFTQNNHSEKRRYLRMKRFSRSEGGDLKNLAFASTYLYGFRRRSRSLDFLHKNRRNISSRTSSPTPSGNPGFIKDSPNNMMLQLDHDNMSDTGISDHHHHSNHHHNQHKSGSGFPSDPVTGMMVEHQNRYSSAISPTPSSTSSTGGGGPNANRPNSSQSSNQQNQPKSVMSGGTVKGWLPDVAVVLWRRMLGALGDINEIADPSIHAQIYKYLIELFEILVKIRNNQGVSLDNSATPPPPEFTPPFTIFAPWCFRALSIPDMAYHRGSLYALRLLCLMTCRPQDAPLTKTHLVQFYRVLHSGLTSTDKTDVMLTLIKFTGPRFFSLCLPGYTAYILDFLFACNCVISSSDLKGVPRTEATSVVGALLSYPALLKGYEEDNKGLPLLVPDPDRLGLISSSDVKDQIIGVLLKSGKKEPAGLARCISLSSLGVFVYSELRHGSFHPKIKEAIQVLLTALRFNNKAVAHIASDTLLLLADHVESFLDFYPEVPKKIVEVLARTLTTLTTRSLNSSSDGGHHSSSGLGGAEDERRLLLSLLFCLGEWVMKMPAYVLTQHQEDGRSLLYHVFGALHTASSESRQSSPKRSPGGGTSGSSNQRLRKQLFHSQSVPGDPNLGPAVMVSDFDPYNNPNADQQNSSANNSAISSPLRSNNHDLDESESTGEDSSSAVREDFVIHDESMLPVRLAAKTVLNHLTNHLFHFPMAEGPDALSSDVQEIDDQIFEENQIETSNSSTDAEDVFSRPNAQIFVVNDSTLLSLVELPVMEEERRFLQLAKTQVRLILRDISGKFCWDSTYIYGEENLAEKRRKDNNKRTSSSAITLTNNNNNNNVSSSNKVSIQLMSPPRQTSRRRHPNVLPDVENTREDMDNLDDLLQYIGHSSPECLENPGKPLNANPMSSILHQDKTSGEIDAEADRELISSVLNQRNVEVDFGQKKLLDKQGLKERPPRLDVEEIFRDLCLTQSKFKQSRRLFSQLGMSLTERRNKVYPAKKSKALLRELKNLDNKRCREAHKIAVIYVAEGQEDKQSILTNTGGSKAYEDFLSGLGWEVELEKHSGFMGGLRKESSGETSPYFATSFVEVMFHVSTRMPSDSEEAVLRKTRHIGNDEIHIVWCEHRREYRRGILPTEFCDVLIVVYPLKNGLFRVQISRKPEIPFFGPLFNEAVVDAAVLPGLVRATAVNASRAKRSTIQYYQHFYEERAKALEQIVNNHKEKCSFEDFIAQTYSPGKNLDESTSVLLPLSSSSASASLATSLNNNISSRPVTWYASNQKTDNNLQQPEHHNHGGGHIEDTSPRVALKQKLLFKTSIPNLSSGSSGNTASSPTTHHGPIAAFGRLSGGDRNQQATRPMSIKEEPGLPNSPPMVPTRKR